MPDIQFTIFREMFSSLFTEPWKFDGAAQGIWEALQWAYPPFVNRQAFEKALPSREDPRCDFSDSRQFLYLQPSSGGKENVFIPVLSLKTDFTQNLPEIRIRVGLFLRHEATIRAVAFRFEAPEGPGGGAHDYYHAQFIRRFHQSDRLIPAVPEWLPETQPSFPLHANGPVTLLAAFLVSIYGFKQLEQFLPSASKRLATALKDYRKRIEDVS